MKQRFQKDDPDVFNLAWLDDEELKGFDPGAISGRMHARTQEALRQFQTANDLPATGVLDQKTADKLWNKVKE